MNLATYYQQYGRQGLEDLATRMGRNAVYLSQIANGHRRAGWRLCHELEEASDGVIDRRHERPDIFSSDSNKGSSAGAG